MAINRYYSAIAQDTTITSGITSSSTTVVVAGTTGYPTSYPFALALDYGSALEEIVDVTGVAGLTLTITRAVNGTTAVAHAAGATVRHVITARDLTDAQTHYNTALSAGAHGITGALATFFGSTTSANLASVVTDETGSGSLTFATNPTITSPVITDLTTKGDLIAGTGSGVITRLAVGSDGQTLVANSATTTGLQWASTPSASNPVLNSAMQVWQRGTSISLAANASATYLADRWVTFTGANQACTVSRQTTSDTTNLPNIQYCLRYQRNNAQTGTGGLYFTQPFESVNSIPFAGKTVTMSFYARKGANYSATSSLLDVYLVTGTGTDQTVITGYTGSINAVGSNATLTTTWQRFTYSATLATNVTELSPLLVFNPTGTAGASDYYEITGVQIDVGSVALPFRTFSTTLQGELAACQRYYVRLDAGTTNYNPITPIGGAISTTSIALTLQPPVTMRTAPSSIEYASMSVYGGSSGGFGFLSASALTLVRATGGMLELNATVSSATAGGFYRLQPNNAAGYVGVIAEL